MYNENNSNVNDYTHAKIPLPQPAVSASHPYRNKKNHEALLQYLRSRIQLGAQNRDRKLPRYTRVDKNVAGWMRLSAEDKKRDIEKENTGSPQATAMNLPLAWVHLDDMMTYFAQTFAPNRGMFYHTGKPGETTQAAQIVTLMNNHAIYSGYFRHVLAGIYSILKYNEGGFCVQWSKENGPKLVRDPNTAADSLTSELKWQGNKLESLDMYNFLSDPSVHPTELYKDGEFAGVAMLKSFFWLQSRASQGIYYNCEEALRGYKADSTSKYYRSPPVEAQFNADDSHGSGTNWVEILSEIPMGGVSGGFELVEMYIRLNPTEFGLVEGNAQAKATRNRYEIWRFTVLNDCHIIDATWMNNIHGHLPYYMGVLNDDVMGTSQKAISEIIQPLQEFASFLLNTHLFATRSSIWGLTAYDPSIIDMRQIPKGEVNATIPIKPAGYGKDINQAIWKHNSTLETKQTLQDLSGVMDIINQFFPTQSLPSQIASIDRAVDSQVAAVQQGANRRQQKAARLLDDCTFRPIRFAMYYNIIQYQPDETEVTDFYSGKQVKINLNELRNTDLPFIIGQGLKSLDRQAAASSLQQIIFALIQAPPAAQQVDLLGLIDYWTSMLDIDVDMTQFRIQTPAQADPANAAPAEGNPIQPATNPQSLTQPIYGG